jgi:hypothetical protein
MTLIHFLYSYMTGQRYGWANPFFEETDFHILLYYIYYILYYIYILLYIILYIYIIIIIFFKRPLASRGNTAINSFTHLDNDDYFFVCCVTTDVYFIFDL